MPLFWVLLTHGCVRSPFLNTFLVIMKAGGGVLVVVLLLLLLVSAVVPALGEMRSLRSARNADALRWGRKTLPGQQ